MDLVIFNFLNQFAGRWLALDGLAIFFARYAGYVLIFVLFLLFFRNFKKQWNTLVALGTSVFLARGIVTEAIRLIWPRVRPFVENNVNLLLSHEASPSFPSGHAAFYFALAAVIYFYNKKIGIVFFAVSFFMGVARIFSGVHWPTDILTGAIVGILSGWFVVKLSKRFLK